MAAAAVAAAPGQARIGSPSQSSTQEDRAGNNGSAESTTRPLEIPISYMGKTCRFGWRANIPPSEFAQQLRGAARHLIGRDALDGVQMYVDSPPIHGGVEVGGGSSSSSTPLRSKDKVTPRDIFEGRIGGAVGGSITLWLPEVPEKSMGAPTVSVRPAGGVSATPVPAVLRPSAGYGRAPTAAKADNTQSGAPATTGPFNGSRGGSQLAFIQMINQNKNPKAELPPGTRLTFEEVRRHRSVGDCWTIFQGKVYDITPYVDFHPGGKQELMKGAGKDMTSLFNKVHPWVSVDGFLGKLCLGQLEKPSALSKAKAELVQKQAEAAVVATQNDGDK